jgi:hypothetical protein
MELAARLARTRTVRRIAPFLLAAALVVVPVAHAKFRLRMVLSDGQPKVGQTVRVTLHANPVQPRDTSLRLLAIPPGVRLYGALSTESRYAVPVVREGRGWRAVVRFRRPGRWRLVVPNWGAPGYAIPPPIVRVVPVTRS